MANVLVEETSLSNIASAIRGKNGSTAVYKPGEMAAAITNLPTGGSGGGEDDFLTRGGSGEYVNDRIEKLGGGAFYQTNYSAITLSNVKVMDGASVIRFNNNLTTLNLPALTTITCTYIEPSISATYGTQISNNASLTALDFPNLITISDSVGQCFAGNPNLVSVNLPSLTTANLLQQFQNCSSLKTVDLSSLQSSTKESSGCWTFQNCSSLQSIDLPNLTQWGSSQDGLGLYYTFSNCTNLQTVNLPVLTNTKLGLYAFQNCTSLTKVKASFKSMSMNCFQNCSALRTLILPQTDSITYLANSTMFEDTLIGKNQDSGIYVPRALVNEYKKATNWTVYADYIRAIEDYPEITGG